MRKTTRAVATAGIALVLSGGAAAAANGSLPDAAQDGLSNAADRVGIELPASKENHPTADDHPGGAPSEVTAVSGATERPDNHGAEVSAVAQTDFATGREHGEAVSTVARDGNGPDAVETPNPGGIGTGAGASGGANSIGTDHAADQASNGSGNAGAPGTP